MSCTHAPGEHAAAIRSLYVEKFGLDAHTELEARAGSAVRQALNTEKHTDREAS